jgi:hypothetical protein
LEALNSDILAAKEAGNRRWEYGGITVSRTVDSETRYFNSNIVTSGSSEAIYWSGRHLMTINASTPLVAIHHYHPLSTPGSQPRAFSDTDMRTYRTITNAGADQFIGVYMVDRHGVRVFRSIVPRRNITMLKVNVLMAAIILAISGCSSDRSLRAHPALVTMGDASLDETHFSADAVPPCLLEVRHFATEDACFGSTAEISDDKYRTLHERLVRSVRRFDRKGGGYTQLPQDKYSLVFEAICTFGFLRSCALDEILMELGVVMSRQSVPYVVTGEALEYHEVLDGVYPEEYDPMEFEHFQHVLKEALQRLELKARADAKQHRCEIDK